MDEISLIKRKRSLNANYVNH